MEKTDIELVGSSETEVIKVDPKSSREVTLDLSELSYDDMVQMSVLESQLSRVSMLGQRMRMGKGDGSDLPIEILDELITLSSPAQMELVFSRTREQMAKVVTNVPRSWFVKSAPATLDFGNPDTYKYLKADKARELRDMIRSAQTNAKN